MLNTKFWSDTFISNLDSLEKLLFLYLITNQYTNICGIYEIPLKQIALDTGIDKENLEKTLLPRLSNANKIYYIHGWIYVVNFSKHQKSSGNIQKGIENGLKDIPIKIKNLIQEIKKNNGLNKGKSITQVGVSDTQVGVFEEIEEEVEREIEKEVEIEKEILSECFRTGNFLSYFKKSKSKHIWIIGYFAKHYGVKFENEDQIKFFIQRNTKAASMLKCYIKNQGKQDSDYKRIIDTFYYLDDELKKDGKIIKWTLETVSKYIDHI